VEGLCTTGADVQPPRHWSCIEYERAAVVTCIHHFELLFLMLPAEYVEQSLCNGLVSVRLSVSSIDTSSGGFAAERGRLQQIAALSSACG